MANSILNPFNGLDVTLGTLLTSAVTATGAGSSNPYPMINNVGAPGNGIVATLIPSYFNPAPPNPSSFDSISFTTAELIQTLNSVCNQYMQGGYMSTNCYSSEQLDIINQLLTGLSNIPAIGIPSFIISMEDTIAKSCLSPMEQQPLFMATLAANKSYSYFIGIIQVPAGNIWVTNGYINGGANDPYSINSVSYWAAAAAEGALLGYANYVSLDPPRVQGNMILSMLGGAAAVNAGKIMFKWASLPPAKCNGGIDPDAAANIVYTFQKGQKTGTIKNHEGGIDPDTAAMMAYMYLKGQKSGQIKG